MAEFTIYIGNKNYSSWSLRAWLVAKASGIAFEEVLIRLYTPESRAELLRTSPSGKMPALKHGELTVWESLAIGDYLAEIRPEARLWPGDPAARAVARAVSAEMHAGFATLRRELPMNMRASVPGRPMTPELRADLDRVAALWTDCRRRFGGGGRYLFGGFTVADAMYAPVASRLKTYGVALEGAAQDYAEALRDYPAYRDWEKDARAEPWVVEQYEFRA